MSTQKNETPKPDQATEVVSVLSEIKAILAESLRGARAGRRLQIVGLVLTIGSLVAGFTIVSFNILALRNQTTGLRLQEEVLAHQQGFAGPFDDKAIVDAALSSSGDMLSALQASGLKVWERRLPGFGAKAVVGMLGEVVAVGMRAGGAHGGQILIYNKEGKLNQTIVTGATAPKDWVRSGNFSVNDLTFIPPTENDSWRIAALTYDSGWFASGVEIFDTQGGLKGDYWNPGGLGKIDTIRLGPKGTEALVVVGNNNDLTALAPGLQQLPTQDFGYLDVVFALDPANVNGLAPPHKGGSHLWYYVLWPFGTHPTRFFQDKWQGIDSVRIETSVGCLFYLGDKGAFNRHGIGDAYRPGTELLTTEELLSLTGR